MTCFSFAHARNHVALVAVLLSSSCVDEAIGRICDDDTACQGGSVCAFGLCVDPSALGTVDIDVEPPSSSPLPSQSVFAIDMQDSGRVDIALRAAVDVSGSITALDGRPVPATVTALPVAAIAGRRRQASTTTTDGSFTLTLISGVAYTLQAAPTDRALPPIFGETTFVAGADPLPPLVLTSVRDEQGRPSHPITVRGRVVAGEGVSELGIPDLEVLVTDAAGKRKSALAITDVDGAFVIGLPVIALKQSGDAPVQTTFVVRPSERNTQFPTVSFPLDLGASDDVEGLDVDLERVSLGSVASPVPVSGVVRTSAGTAVADAVVSFRALVGAGTVAARTTTSSDGRFSVALHPGSYSTGVVGPVSGEAGTLLTSFEVTVPIDDVVFTVPQRVAFSLSIRDADGLGVPLASVVATRVGDVVGLAEPVLQDAQPVWVAAADDSGETRLFVDVGRYRVSVQPPRGSGAPAFSALLTVSAAEERTFELPPAVVVAGSLFDTGAPVSQAFVRVFSGITDELGRAIFLGEALSDADGAFTAFVPAL